MAIDLATPALASTRTPPSSSRKQTVKLCTGSTSCVLTPDPETGLCREHRAQTIASVQERLAEGAAQAQAKSGWARGYVAAKPEPPKVEAKPVITEDLGPDRLPVEAKPLSRWACQRCTHNQGKHRKTGCNAIGCECAGAVKRCTGCDGWHGWGRSSDLCRACEGKQQVAAVDKPDEMTGVCETREQATAMAALLTEPSATEPQVVVVELAGPTDAVQRPPEPQPALKPSARGQGGIVNPPMLPWVSGGGDTPEHFRPFKVPPRSAWLSRSALSEAALLLERLRHERSILDQKIYALKQLLEVSS